MFRCEKCRRKAWPGEKPVRIVIMTREKTYPERWEGHGHNRHMIDKGGKGWEIAKEKLTCKSCAETSSKRDS